MTLRFTLALCLLAGLFVPACLSQNDFLPGYFRLLSGDSVSANLSTEYLKALKTGKLIIIKKENLAPIHVLLDDLRAFGIHSGVRFEKMYLIRPNDSLPSLNWVKALVIGSGSLYEYEESGRNYWYVSREGGPLIWLPNQAQVGGATVGGQQAPSASGSFYLAKLRGLFGDCQEVFALLSSELNYSKTNFIKVVSLFNEACTDQPFTKAVPGKGIPIVSVRPLLELPYPFNLTSKDSYSRMVLLGFQTRILLPRFSRNVFFDLTLHGHQYLLETQPLIQFINSGNSNIRFETWDSTLNTGLLLGGRLGYMPSVASKFKPYATAGIALHGRQEKGTSYFSQRLAGSSSMSEIRSPVNEIKRNTIFQGALGVIYPFAGHFEVQFEIGRRVYEYALIGIGYDFRIK